MQNPLVNYLSPAYGGPYGLQAYLMPPFFGGALFESPWIPLTAVKSLSLEVAGSLGGGTLSLQLVGTDDPNVGGAANTYTVTIGGTITNGDTLTATFSNPNLASGTEAVTIPVGTSDTTTTLATALAAAINADANLAALGIGAKSAAAVVTVSFPSVAPQSAVPQLAPSGGGSAQFANFTAITGSKTGAGTETITVAGGSGGTNLGSAVTALGLTAVAAPLPLFVKARMTLSGASNASITAAIGAAI